MISASQVSILNAQVNEPMFSAATKVNAGYCHSNSFLDPEKSFRKNSVSLLGLVQNLCLFETILGLLEIKYLYYVVLLYISACLFKVEPTVTSLHLHFGICVL